MNKERVDLVMKEIEEEKKNMTEQERVSDGDHTFGELYDHRSKLFSFILNTHPEISFKSRLHDDGTMFDGYFIAGIKTPEGYFTYHFKNVYWNLITAKEVEKAPKWDGHTSDDISRIFSIGKSLEEHASYLKKQIFLSEAEPESEKFVDEALAYARKYNLDILDPETLEFLYRAERDSKYRDEVSKQSSK